MRKPTYYLWRNDFSSQEEFEAERRKYVGIGFRVVTFQDGNPDTDIHEGIKALVKITGMILCDFTLSHFIQTGFFIFQNIYCRIMQSVLHAIAYIEDESPRYV